LKFEGVSHESEISFFLVNNDPGAGPGPHKHPYSETWIVRAGKARFTAGDEEIEAGPGDILVVGANTPHKFRNVGSGKLEVTCIHAAPRMVQVELE
jgi:mannose-6-phosphate isomerase-like protein (cupin superfamily)